MSLYLLLFYPPPIKGDVTFTWYDYRGKHFRLFSSFYHSSVSFVLCPAGMAFHYHVHSRALNTAQKRSSGGWIFISNFLHINTTERSPNPVFVVILPTSSLWAESMSFAHQTFSFLKLISPLAYGGWISKYSKWINNWPLCRTL